MARIEIARGGCCPENYNPKPGSWGRCWFIYGAAAWGRHIRGAAWIESLEAEALPGQWLLPGVTVQEGKGAGTPAAGGRWREEWRGEKHCFHCGELFSFKRQHAEFCTPTCREDSYAYLCIQAGLPLYPDLPGGLPPGGAVAVGGGRPLY